MKKGILLTLLLSLVLCIGAMAGAATAKKPAPKKPAPKPAPKAAAPAVALPGDNGVFGKVYKMRTERPLYFRLKSAEFTTQQVLIGETLYVPKADEKLLVLHFTIQNPNKDEQEVRWDSLRFTAVDKANSNCEGDSYWGDDDSKKSTMLDMTLKPTQTVNAYAVILVPAEGVVPKLMVLPDYEENGPILRYDLTGKTVKENKVAPLKAPIADPEDKSGYTALETVPGELGASYPYANFDIAVQSMELTADKLRKDDDLEEGARYFVATLVMKNESAEKPVLRWDTVEPVLTSTDGEELEYLDMLLATANRSIEIEPKQGAETTVRIIFMVPDGVTPATLSLKEGESRTYEFKVQP